MIITYVSAISLWLPMHARQLKADEIAKAHFMNQPDDPAILEGAR